MSLLDEIVQVQTSPRKCGLGTALRSMEDDLRKEFVAALGNPNLQHKAIATVFKNRGYNVSRFQVAECRKCVDTGCECGAL